MLTFDMSLLWSALILILVSSYKHLAALRPAQPRAHTITPLSKDLWLLFGPSSRLVGHFCYSHRFAEVPNRPL